MTIEEKIKQFADATQLDGRKDLGITIEVGYMWDAATQSRSEELEFKVFAYRNRESCAPAPTIEAALENAAAAIVRIECKKCCGRGYLCEPLKGKPNGFHEYKFFIDDDGGLIPCNHAG